MKVKLVFGSEWIEAEVPENAKIVKPGFGIKVEAAANQRETIEEAIKNPLDVAPLSEAKPSWKVTIAFDDPTVPCFAPMWEFAILCIAEELKKAGVPKDNITLICANALHRKFRLSELEKILGKSVVNYFDGRIICHDAEDKNAIVKLGETSSGYDVEVHRAVVESDLLIYVNTVATAFNGGWKSICVGLSTWKSIRWHHTPDIMSMSADRNPMHEILNEMGEVVKSEVRRDIFKIETLLANPLEVSRVWAGSVDATRRELLNVWKARGIRRRDLLDEKVDIICYGVPDWSPYAAFSFMNPLLTLLSTGLGYLGGVIEAIGKKGCSVIMATPCPNRWDTLHHAAYLEVWKILGSERDPNEIMRKYEKRFAENKDYIAKYRFKYAFHPVHGLMATYPLKRLNHASEIIVAGIEDAKTAEHVGFSATKSVEDAIAMALDVHGKDASIAIVQYPMMINRQ